MAYHFLGGLLAHAPALTALCAPTVNSYKRLVVGRSLTGATWAPAYISYGDNNRSTMVRIPKGRLELRLRDGSCNPYLATAAVIAAGLDGIAKKIDPGAPRNVNLYEWSEAQLKEAGIGLLPQNLDAALDALQADRVICEALGPVAGEFLKLKRMEWIEYMRHVSDWEIRQLPRIFLKGRISHVRNCRTAAEKAGAARAPGRADGADADRHDRAWPGLGRHGGLRRPACPNRSARSACIRA